MGVHLERAGSAAIVVLDWPEQRNALGPEEAIEVTEALRDAPLDPTTCAASSSPGTVRSAPAAT